MTSYADQSDITNEAHLWAFIVVTAAALFLGWAVYLWHHARTAKRWEDNRPAPVFRRCWTTACTYPATVMAMRTVGQGRVEVLDVCKGCADEGTAHKWWVVLDMDEPVPFWPTDRAERAS